MDSKLISVIIAVVNEDRKYLDNCVRSIEKSARYAKVTLEFIIIANGTDLKDSFGLKSKFRIIKNKKNVGFGRAINQGIKLVKSKWCLIVCPDTITSNSCFKVVLRHTSLEDIAIIAPKVTSLDGKLEHTILPSSNLLQIFLEQSYLYKILPSIFHHSLSYTRIYNNFRYIKISAANWWLINNKIFQKRGGFDKRFKLYFEDVDLCNRLNNKYQIVYEPNAFVHHLKHQSNVGIMMADKYLDSLYKYLCKYHSRIYAFIGITLVFLGNLIRLIYWRLRKLYATYSNNRSPTKDITQKIIYCSNIIKAYLSYL